MSEEGTGGTVGTLAEYTPELRVLAVAFCGVGDLLTTLVGLHGDRAVEFGVGAVPCLLKFPLSLAALFVVRLLVSTLFTVRHLPRYGVDSDNCMAVRTSRLGERPI